MFEVVLPLAVLLSVSLAPVSLQRSCMPAGWFVEFVEFMEFVEFVVVVSVPGVVGVVTVAPPVALPEAPPVVPETPPETLPLASPLAPACLSHGARGRERQGKNGSCENLLHHQEISIGLHR
ncbi:hypothetical protein [Mesorhizobium sp.]|uniref:hypothetical protein n=1 Tax=Mesorhizobium sp. TaxID=1871066 RepID=UPI0025F586E5|nr:hypothetical protein [Mesorhizobium sp.]